MAYITVIHDEKSLALSLNRNGNLDLSVLNQYFPQARGLTYTNRAGEIYGLEIIENEIVIDDTTRNYMVYIIEDDVSSLFTIDDIASESMKRELLIIKYFEENYTYKEIKNLLLQNHHILISLRQLQRITRSLNLKRRNIDEDSLEEISSAIIDEIFGSGCCLGYKTLWQRLKLNYGLKVKRETVHQILSVIDPIGIEERSRRRLRRRKYNVPGPNFLWHIDGYDKLKPFGFAIHGCIDGFSRKILWLEVASSNNKPEIIAHYFLRAVDKYKILPTLIRSDCGTENTIIECLQQSLRFNHNDELAGYKSFIKGKSTSNQRIESYWSQLRRHGLDFWISFFKDMRDKNIYNDSNPIHVECLKYCFGPLIKFELNIIRREWNRHRIRKQKGRAVPPGKPNCLFYIPELIKAKNYKKPIDDRSIRIAQTHYTIQPQMYSEDFKEIVKTLIPNEVKIYDIESSFNLYLKILKLIESLNNK